MNSYREPDVYKASKALGEGVHKMSLALPKFELYEEGSQIRRSSKSITSVIAEGYGRRRGNAGFIKYLVYSRSECDETIVQPVFYLKHNRYKTRPCTPI